MALEETMSLTGNTVEIFENYGLPHQTRQEARALKNGNVFVFLQRVKKNSVLKVKGAHDVWRVIDTEDEVLGEELISVKVRVIKEEATKPRSISSAPIIINNHNSPGANFNLGNGNIQQSWLELTSQKIDSAVATSEEKQKAKSLLIQISENKLLSTIIGSAVGELTKAILPK